MKRRKKRERGGKRDFLHLTIIGIICLFSSFSIPVNAQCKLNNSAIETNEHIEYALYFYWGIIWKEAGSATYTTSKTTYQDKEALKINLLMSTNDVADNFFKMRDTLTSIVSNNLEPLYHRKAAEEGKRYTIDEVFYNYQDNISFAKLKRTWKSGKANEWDEKRNECIYDMLSILCKARTFESSDFKKGERFNIQMATGKEVESLVLEYRGLENIKSEDKETYQCMVYTLLKKEKKNKLKDFISFYLSNDNDKLLVKLKLNLNFGSAQVNLKKIKHK